MSILTALYCWVSQSSIKPLKLWTFVYNWKFIPKKQRWTSVFTLVVRKGSQCFYTIAYRDGLNYISCVLTDLLNISRNHIWLTPLLKYSCSHVFESRSGKVYSDYVIKFVSSLCSPVSSTNETEILLKVALNTIKKQQQTNH
jgi:hypothetical protein